MRVNQLNKKCELQQLLLNPHGDIKPHISGGMHVTGLPYLQSPLKHTLFSNIRNRSAFSYKEDNTKISAKQVYILKSESN